jgi:hypothetical protein
VQFLSTDRTDSGLEQNPAACRRSLRSISLRLAARWAQEATGWRFCLRTRAPVPELRLWALYRDAAVLAGSARSWRRARCGRRKTRMLAREPRTRNARNAPIGVAGTIPQFFTLVNQFNYLQTFHRRCHPNALIENK